jgi:hypothetical protein
LLLYQEGPPSLGNCTKTCGLDMSSPGSPSLVYDSENRPSLLITRKDPVSPYQDMNYQAEASGWTCPSAWMFILVIGWDWGFFPLLYFLGPQSNCHQLTAAAQKVWRGKEWPTVYYKSELPGRRNSCIGLELHSYSVLTSRVKTRP